MHNFAEVLFQQEESTIRKIQNDSMKSKTQLWAYLIVPPGITQSQLQLTG